MFWATESGVVTPALPLTVCLSDSRMQSDFSEASIRCSLWRFSLKASKICSRSDSSGDNCNQTKHNIKRKKGVKTKMKKKKQRGQGSRDAHWRISWCFNHSSLCEALRHFWWILLNVIYNLIEHHSAVSFFLVSCDASKQLHWWVSVLVWI